MSNKPLVSVIVIFLNAARFLSEAVESVFAQTYGSWELLLVDDGSTDGSTEMARGYAERHPDRIRYLSHSDSSKSRDECIAESRVESCEGGLHRVLRCR